MVTENINIGYGILDVINNVKEPGNVYEQISYDLIKDITCNMPIKLKKESLKVFKEIYKSFIVENKIHKDKCFLNFKNL